MDNHIQYFKYDPEENRFTTLDEFKIYFDYCTELSFAYHGTEYGVDKDEPDGTFYISNCTQRICMQNGLTLEQVLNYVIDGVRIRDFITTDEVEITDRPGPM